MRRRDVGLLSTALLTLGALLLLDPFAADPDSSELPRPGTGRTADAVRDELSEHATRSSKAARTPVVETPGSARSAERTSSRGDGADPDKVANPFERVFSPFLLQSPSQIDASEVRAAFLAAIKESERYGQFAKFVASGRLTGARAAQRVLRALHEVLPRDPQFFRALVEGVISAELVTGRRSLVVLLAGKPALADTLIQCPDLRRQLRERIVARRDEYALLYLLRDATGDGEDDSDWLRQLGHLLADESVPEVTMVVPELAVATNKEHFAAAVSLAGRRGVSARRRLRLLGGLLGPRSMRAIRANPEKFEAGMEAIRTSAVRVARRMLGEVRRDGDVELFAVSRALSVVIAANGGESATSLTAALLEHDHPRVRFAVIFAWSENKRPVPALVRDMSFQGLDDQTARIDVRTYACKTLARAAHGDPALTRRPTSAVEGLPEGRLKPSCESWLRHRW